MSLSTKNPRPVLGVAAGGIHVAAQNQKFIRDDGRQCVQVEGPAGLRCWSVVVKGEIGEVCTATITWR